MVNWSDNRINGIGPTPAKIMLVGEAPGDTEDKEGKPFVGLAGRVLDGILEEVGLNRDELYITNLCKHRPTNNNFDNFTEEYLAQAKAEIQEEIAIVQPNVIVTLGEEAFKALTGLHNITKWRGSVLETKLGKVIPVIHPAAISREWSFRPATICDFGRVKSEATYAEVRRHPRRLRTMPDYGDVIDYLNTIKKNKTKISFDIETETNQITCMGIATSPEEATCISFWFGSSGSFYSEEQEGMIWQLLRQILEDESIPKIAQNAQYDCTILHDKYGICVRGLWLDTMIAFHALYPELPKGLDFLTSIYTDVPYYKFLRKTDDMVKFFEYNATDAVVTYECAEKIYAEMKEFGVDKFYYEHMHSLIYPLMDITYTGVRIDRQLKKEATEKYKETIAELQGKLSTAVGHELNPASHKQMVNWLYTELGFDKVYKLRKGKGTKTLAADAEALEELYKKYKNEALKIILDIRENQKILSTYLEVNYDKEKNANGEVVERARTSYLITGTETGRLSSRETVYGTGTNLQNVPKGVARQIFIPDDGNIFVNADLSQAEARVVAYLAGDERLIRVFDEGGDIHRKNAANIFHKASEDVTSEEREIAKRVVHASNYLIGPVTFAKSAGVSVADAKRLLNQYFAEYPRIKLWHMQVSSQLKRTRVLTTPFGRKRTFFNRWNETLLREAVAFVPQSTVADLLNMGLRRLYAKYQGTSNRLLLQIHDAVLLQCPKDSWERVAKEVKETLTIPVRIGSRTLVIPCDISVGPNWNDLKKFKC